MKKLISLALVLVLCLTAAGSLAERFAPRPITLTPEKVANRMIDVKITDVTDTKMSMVLLEAETFSAEDVAKMTVGDVIFAGGEELTITNIDKDDDYVYFNQVEGEEESDEDVYLIQDYNGDYVAMFYESVLWQDAAAITVDMDPYIVLLDGINPEDGEWLDVPTLYGPEGFVKLFADEKANDGIGFASYNVQVVFDGIGEPIIVRRNYVQ